MLELLRGLEQATVQQTQVLSRQTDILEEQTGLLRKLLEGRVEGPGRYRG